MHKAIANGILGSALASQIQANEDAKRRVVFFENSAEWSDLHSRKLQLLNLLAPLALGNLDIFSTSPSYLAVTCSVCGV